MRKTLTMSNSETRDGEMGRKGDGAKAFPPRLPVSPSLRLFILLLTVHCLLLTVGCRQDMQNQPKYVPYRSSSFFRDELSGRPLVEGTVPRGYLRSDREFYTGKKNKPVGIQSATGNQNTSTPQQNTAAQNAAGLPATSNQSATYPDDVETLPFPVTAETVNRGQERYQIFCAVCHGMTGHGDGMIVRRGFRPPPSYHDDRLRQAPVGHFFDVITNGWGAMPSYAAQVTPQDRWAIIAYIRALQLSQWPAGSTAPASERGNSPSTSQGVNNQTKVTQK
ncbi:MAG: cytochrome c [Pyrinomonadaceae bacterium]